MDDQKEQNNRDPRDLFIQNLLIKKHEIETVIEGLKEGSNAFEQNRSSNDFFEEIDRANNEISTQQYYILLERKYSELKKIEACINKISKDEDFGWCEECGDRISMERLSVLPDATRCIRCQREYEKIESRKGHTLREYKMPNDEDDLEDENIGDVQGLKVFIGTINNDLIPIDDLEDMDLAGG
jgi:DnaK suppressor protein